MLTVDQLKKIAPACRDPEGWAPLFDATLYHENFTLRQAAMFLAQTGHESGDFNTLVENLNYSSDRLLVVFPKYFKGVNDISKFNRNPEAIANVVYANRMGNGDTDSGEGYKFRGRGILQVTGKANYMKCSEFIYGNEESLLEDPDMLEHQEDAINSALWFWKTHNLINVKDCNAVTQIINGGQTGAADRLNRFNNAYAVLSQ